MVGDAFHLGRNGWSAIALVMRYGLQCFWPTVLSVEPLAQCVVCRLSVCLSVVCL